MRPSPTFARLRRYVSDRSIGISSLFHACVSLPRVLKVLFRFHVHFVLYMAENLEQHRSLLSNFEAFVAVGILG